MIPGLFALVQNRSAITDLIGSGDDCRFYPTKLPQGLSHYPAATFKWYNNRDNDDFDSVSRYDFGYVDIHCYGRVYDDALDLWLTMRKSLERQKGIYGGVNIRDIKYMDSGAEDYMEEENFHTKQLELRISYIRTLN